jgi:hypothetical protein
MRIFQDLDDEDHHPDSSGSGPDYSSGCDSSTEEFGIAASSPASSPEPAKNLTSPASSSSSSTGARPTTSPRTVRFDLGVVELSGDAALKKLTQAQVDLTTERTLRRRKEKTIVKLARELNKRIVEGEKKDKKIREVSYVVSRALLSD